MSKKGYVYILSNNTNNVLYIGVTNDLIRRIYEHKEKIIAGFTQKYNISKLVYFEIYENIEQAITREKQLKNWHRDWKIKLIKEHNPEFNDLYEQITK